MTDENPAMPATTSSNFVFVSFVAVREMARLSKSRVSNRELVVAVRVQLPALCLLLATSSSLLDTLDLDSLVIARTARKLTKKK